MSRIKRFTAMAAALALLTGCSGNDTSSQQSAQPETAEVSVPAQSTGVSQQGEAPAGVTDTAGGEVQPEQTLQDGNGGISLVSGKYSDFDDIFQLNGEWCGLSDMLLTVDEYNPEGDFSDYIVFGVIGTRLVLAKGNPGDVIFDSYTYDLESGELKMICGGYPVCFNEKYLVVTGNTDFSIKVYDINNGDLVVSIPDEGEGRIGFCSGNCALNNDVLFFDSNVSIEGNETVIPAVFTCSLESGAIRLLKLNASSPRYGYGNVIMDLYDSGYYYYSINGTYFNTEGIYGRSYYPVSVTTQDSDVLLGDHRLVSVMVDKDADADIGVAGGFYEPIGISFNRNGLFTMSLTSPLKNYNVVGQYNISTGTIKATRDTEFFSSLPYQESNAVYQTYVNDDGIWCVDKNDGKLRAVLVREIGAGENAES